MKAELATKTKQYIVCPHCECDDTFAVSHLLETKGKKTLGTWYCDKCGKSISGTVSEDGSVEIEKTDRTKEDCHVLLELEPQKHSVFLVAKGMFFNGLFKSSDKQYYYEEHTCPLNYFREAEVVMTEESSDPHGLFKYKGGIPKQLEPEFDELSAEEILQLFREAAL